MWQEQEAEKKIVVVVGIPELVDLRSLSLWYQ